MEFLSFFLLVLKICIDPKCVDDSYERSNKDFDIYYRISINYLESH